MLLALRVTLTIRLNWSGRSLGLRPGGFRSHVVPWSSRFDHCRRTCGIAAVHCFSNMSAHEAAGVRLLPGRRTAAQLQMSSGAASGTEASPVLSGKRDAYDGLIIDPGTVPSSSESFEAELQVCLPAWREEGYRGIWLKLPIDKARHVGPAVDAGFVYHHAEQDYVMLTRWLPDLENKLPPNATHQVGVGAFVYDRQARRLLVVQERSGPLRGKAVWKMPTGLVQAGEDITEAAVREVREETGVSARFRAVLAMRQAHGFAFGKSDIFFVVALEPESGFHELVPQEDEIEAVQWMSLAEYAALDFYADRPLLKKIMERCIAYADGRYAGLTGNKLAAGFSGRDDLLLFGESVEDGGGSGDGAAGQDNEDAWIGLN